MYAKLTIPERLKDLRVVKQTNSEVVERIGQMVP